MWTRLRSAMVSYKLANPGVLGLIFVVFVPRLFQWEACQSHANIGWYWYQDNLPPFHKRKLEKALLIQTQSISFTLTYGKPFGYIPIYCRYSFWIQISAFKIEALFRIEISLIEIQISISNEVIKLEKKIIEKSRECHNHKPQPTPNTKKKKKWQTLTRIKQTSAREAHRPAPSSPSEVITMLKGMKKHKQKEHGETLKHEAPRSINHKATQNKHNTGTTALEWSVA